jgi:ABC-type polysaccharide/polyol phosphate export permease
MFAEMLHYQDLLASLVARDIRIRYKQAVMGFMWALFMPIIAIGAGILIKKAMAVVSHQQVELLSVVSISIKVLPWTFFVNSIRFCVTSLVGNSALVTKIYFPREVLPLSSVIACAVDFALAVIFLIILLAFFKLGVSIHLLWVPLILLFFFLFTYGVGLLLSAANLFYRDVRYIVEIILMFGIFFTPVFYQASSFGNWSKLLLINPIGSMLEAIDTVVVFKHAPDLHWLAYAGVASIITFFAGIIVFRKLEPLFAEYI